MTSQSLKLSDFEHLETVECTYSQRGIHSIRFKTNTGKQIMVEGTAGLGNFKRTVRLRPHNKAVIGFRGVFQTPDFTEIDL
jgi:Jacalin-like lectin domain